MMAKDTIRKNYRIPKKTLEDIEFIINNSTARTETDAIILSLKKYADELRSEKELPDIEKRVSELVEERIDEIVEKRVTEMLRKAKENGKELSSASVNEVKFK